MALHFPQRQSRSPFRSFSARFVCLADELTSPSHCYLLLVQSRMVRSSHPEVFYRKGALRNFAKFTGKHLSQSLFFTKICRSEACNFIKNETLAQTFSCEFCEISKNTFFTEHLQATASVWFCLSKLEKLSSESEELKEASLDNKLESLIAGS